MIPTTTNSGLHDFVGNQILAGLVRPGLKAGDLGSGPGAMAARLAELGCDVLAADITKNGFEAKLPHVTVDFNQPDFASLMGPRQFGLVTAIEVIEHVESPIGFLLLFPYTYEGLSSLEDFILNTLLWVSLGILFRLPTLAGDVQGQIPTTSSASALRTS